MKKKKIFIYIHQGILKGGVEKVFHTLLNNLPLEEYNITVLSVMGYLKDDFEIQLYPHVVKRYCLMWDELSKTNRIKRTVQKIHNRIFPSLFKLYLKLKKYDVAIAAQEGSYASFVINNVNAYRKLLWVHNDIQQCHWTLKHFGSVDAEFNCYKQFDKIACVSEVVMDSMKSTIGKLDNLCVCHNPIDTMMIDQKLKEAPPKRPSDTWFVCVGRLANQKGYDRLINVCKRLNDEGYKYNVSILGDGEDHHVLEQMIQNYNITNICLLGTQTNPYRYINTADWFLQTSRHEGFSLALYESAYCKTPIITTEVAGAKECLGESEFGIVTDNSEEGIYKSMKMVLDSPELHKQYLDAIKMRASFVNLSKRIDNIKSLIDGSDGS